MDYKSLAIWALGRHTGASAECIACHMIGIGERKDYPSDGGDFDRCEALLDAMPEFRARLPEMASVSPYWAALVARWEDIRRCDDKYAVIQSIVRPVEDADSSVIRLGEGVTLRRGL